jgi:hypothetical protein
MAEPRRYAKCKTPKRFSPSTKNVARKYATTQFTPGNRREHAEVKKIHSEERNPREPCALKVASTVRRGADGKGDAIGYPLEDT